MTQAALFSTGECDAVGVKFTNPVRDDHAVVFREGVRSWKERSRVSLGTHAKKNQVEAGQLAFTEAEKGP
jgi:hypothetical protein